jgi:O-antigen/teichoic acid export membrane protein
MIRRKLGLDTLEALTNAAIGLVISWSATYWLLPFWGLHPTAGGAAGITAMFFCISFARSFVLRRLFRRADG